MLEIKVFFIKTRHARPLSISEQSQKLGEVPNICRKENVTSTLEKHEDLQNHRLVRLTSIPEKVMVQLILGTISRNMKYKKSDQEAFTKGESCSTNVMTFYNEMTA